MKEDKELFTDVNELCHIEFCDIPVSHNIIINYADTPIIIKVCLAHLGKLLKYDKQNKMCQS